MGNTLTHTLNPFFSSPSGHDLNPMFNYNGENNGVKLNGCINKNNYTEQEVIQNLITEKIKQFGLRGIYIIRTENCKDKIFGESVNNYKYSFHLEVETESPTDYANFLDGVNLFGYNMQTQELIIRCSSQRIHEEMDKLAATLALTNEKLPRPFPASGDLLWLPIWNVSGTLLQIIFIDDKDPSYVLGTSPLTTMRCKAFDLGSEHFETGIPQIDTLNNFDDIFFNNKADEVDVDVNFDENVSDRQQYQDEAEMKRIEEPTVWGNLLNEEE